MVICKFLMCRCYFKKSNQRNREIFQESKDFSCGCRKRHLYFVMACKNYPFMEVLHRKDKCYCEDLYQEMCDFGNSIELLFNQNVIKICTKDATNYFTKVVDLKTCLVEKLVPSKCFFNFKDNKVYCEAIF